MNSKTDGNGKTLQKKIKNLEFLISSSQLLNSTLDFDRLLRLIMRIVKDAIDVEAVSILFPSADGRQLVFERVRGRRDKSVRGLRVPVGEGVVGWVAEHGLPLIVNNVKKDQRFSLSLEQKLRLNPHSIICIPLVREDDLIGVVEGVNKKGREPFTEEDLSLLLALGDHICAAMENARLYRETERKRLESELLNKVSMTLGKSIDVNEVVDYILDSLSRLIHYDAAAVFVVDRKKQELITFHHRGYREEKQKLVQLKHYEGLVGWVARNKKGVFVGDTSTDSRYVNARNKTHSELVTPMLSRSKVIGVFNLESNQLNAYDKDDLKLLETFAAQAAVAIERAELYEEQRKKIEIQKELKVARTVQEFFTPRKSTRFGKFKIAGASFPSLEMSGDYYDFFPLQKPYIAFAIADVAGKGVPASLIMSSFRASLHMIAQQSYSARQIAVKANEVLLETARPQDFVTAFLGVLNPVTGEICYCKAGHDPPVLMDTKGGHRLLSTGGPVLGVFEDIPIEEGRLVMTDETLVCFTDGATESRNDDDEEYGVDRIVESIKRHRDLTPRKICNALLEDLERFAGGNPLLDDVTFLVLKKS
jgi:sigma-B regulation protein RsbU (phosphoserine phosphatase)